MSKLVGDRRRRRWRGLHGADIVRVRVKLRVSMGDARMFGLGRSFSGLWQWQTKSAGGSWVDVLMVRHVG